LPTLRQHGENFVIWKTQLKLQITGMGKACYINGCTTAPVEPTLLDKANNAAKAAHKKALEEYNELLDEWEQNNEKICTLFFATIHQTHKIRITNHSSARESWNELCKMYEHHGELHAQSLIDHAHQLKCPESEYDLCSTLDELDLLIADHTSADGTLTDSENKNIPEETGIVSCSFTALLDSGTNCHYYPLHKHFINYHTIDAIPISSADNHTLYTTGCSKVPIT
ncbi:hypothetical protein DFH08DRAFT_627001, partial [Mycena albidolilacea]